MGHIEDKLMLWGAVIRVRSLAGSTAMPPAEEIAFICGSEGGGGSASRSNVSNVMVEFCEVDSFLQKQGRFVYDLLRREYAEGVKDTSDSDHVFLVKTWRTDMWQPGDQCPISPAAKVLGVKPESLVKWRINQVKRRLAKEKGWEFEKKPASFEPSHTS